MFFFCEPSSCVDDPTWYTPANSCTESTYYPADMGGRGTDDDTFKAPPCGRHA